MKPVIEVKALSKKYRLGLKESRSETIAASLWQTLKAPIDNFKRIRKLSAFEEDSESIFWALHEISFSVQQGEVLGIIGHNGAGKSTLLKILSQITYPSSGEVVMRGRVASLLEVGTGFHPELTGRENVYMNGTILGMTRKEIDRKFDEIVDFSGVEKHLDTPVKFYSSGMKVRLGFAVAAHLEPEILIVDEVLAVGDIGFQRKCLGKMGEVASGGRTVLFVSHQMAAVQALCSRGLLLANGKVLCNGDVNTVVHSYLQAFNPESVTELSTTTEREGNSKARIVDFCLLDDNHQPLASTYSGGDLILKFSIYKMDNTILSGVDIGFSIHNTDDDSLCTILYGSYTGKLFTLKNDRTELCCRINNLPLPEGKYKVRAQLMQNGEVVDYPTQGVGYLEVMTGDFFGTGVRADKLTRSKPEFLMSGTWTTYES
ncbi:MAG: ABC transporter ATP-binding protein [Cytophagales bacterium]|nr:ABC transporter ATP-binding protein [Cytophagales bacterium]